MLFLLLSVQHKYRANQTWPSIKLDSLYVYIKFYFPVFYTKSTECVFVLLNHPTTRCCLGLSEDGYWS